MSELSAAIGADMAAQQIIGQLGVCIFPPAGPWSNRQEQRKAERVFEVEGGRYVREYHGMIFSGYRWEASDDAGEAPG